MKNRFALIIGNSSYPGSPLQNPVNDALAIQTKLELLGFDTLALTDAKNIDMGKALNNFSSEINFRDVALFFFAGHGMQIDGENYLTAVDTDFNEEINAKYTSLPLNKIIDIMEKGSNHTDIIMLDACRTNPYERKWRGAESRGLAPVYAPKGMIIAYATSPGQVAYDGDGKNGAYTDAFLKHVSTPDTTIEDLFKRVRNTLSSSTRGRQISWEHTSLMGDFYFNYSYISDDLVAEYTEAALADARYKPHSSEQVRKIIGGLRSHNWPTQNTAITAITPNNLKTFNKNDLFVLGRNIYQAACGTATQAMTYLENLQAQLAAVGENTGFHMLNGMLFEIYFDSEGRFRNTAKSDEIDNVFQMEESDDFQTSFEFIQQALRPYAKNLFYAPSSGRGISADVLCIDFEDDEVAVEGIYFEGDNVLYDESGENYFDPNTNNFITKMRKNKIIESISQAMVVPTYRLKVNFLNIDDDVETVLAPYNMNIKRLSN